jgi:hypothetical protein
MEVVEGGVYSLSGDAGFGGWFERRKEDICRQQLAYNPFKLDKLDDFKTGKSWEETVEIGW